MLTATIIECKIRDEWWGPIIDWRIRNVASDISGGMHIFTTTAVEEQIEFRVYNWIKRPIKLFIEQPGGSDTSRLQR